MAARELLSEDAKRPSLTSYEATALIYATARKIFSCPRTCSLPLRMAFIRLRQASLLRLLRAACRYSLLTTTLLYITIVTATTTISRIIRLRAAITIFEFYYAISFYGYGNVGISKADSALPARAAIYS